MIRENSPMLYTEDSKEVADKLGPSPRGRVKVLKCATYGVVSLGKAVSLEALDSVFRRAVSEYSAALRSECSRVSFVVYRGVIMHKKGAEFYSDGALLKGDLYLPPGHRAGERHPAIVLCHGFAGIRDLLLPGFAERFSESGYVAESGTMKLTG